MGQTILSESLSAIEAEIAAGQVEQALAHCQDMQTRYPRALAVQRVLGETWLALRKPREALGALDRALAGNPEDVRACCARAIVHQMHGDAMAALAWYGRACDVRPNDQALRATYREMAAQVGQSAYRPSRVGLARLYLHGGLATHALREWELLLAERPDLLDAQVGLIETLWRIGHSAQAEEWSRRIQVNTPSCVKAMLIGAIVAHDDGRTDDAERLIQRVAQLDPDQRIAQTLFADRLAAGDRALSVLLWGADAPEPQPPSPPPAPSSPQAGATPFGNQSSAAISAASAPSGASTFSRGASSAPRGSSSAQSSQPFPRNAPTSGPTDGRGGVIRPLVDARQSNTPASQAQFPHLADQPAGLPGQPGERTPQAIATTPTAPLSPLPPRPMALPPTFRSIFKETEGMIWDTDETDSFGNSLGAANGQPAARAVENGFGATAVGLGGPPGAPPASETTPGDAFARSTQFVPPMIAQRSAEMEDTEAHRAINWVHWLQAQGARTLSPGQPAGGETPDNPTATDGASQAAPRPLWEADTPARGAPSTRATDSLRPTARPAPGVGGVTTPLAPLSPLSSPLTPAASTVSVVPAHSQPSPEALRQMFAQLEPEAGAHEIVDADVIAASSESAPHHTQPRPTAAPAAGSSSVTGVTTTPDANDSREPVPVLAAPAGSAAFSAPVTISVSAAPDAPVESEQSEALTLEALERSFADSGFQEFTIAPGSLAALVEQPSDATDDMANTAPRARVTGMSDAQAREAGDVGASASQAVADATVPAEEPSSMPEVPSGPDPKDYAARLELARRKRSEGALDEAFVEYNAILRNAPDLLDEVMRDLQSLDADEAQHPEAHRLLGDARIRQGDYMSALESLNRATALSQAQEDQA